MDNQNTSNLSAGFGQPCPSCGYCPTCGRPQQRWYPYYYQQPFYYGTTTLGTGLQGTPGNIQ